MKDVQFRYKSSVGVCGGARGGIISNKCIYKKKIKSTYHGVINVRPSTDAGPTTRGRRLVNGQIQTLANRLHISPSNIIRRANIGPNISTQRLGCSRWPNVGRTLACQLRRSTNHANHVPTLDQRLVADWVTYYVCTQTIQLYASSKSLSKEEQYSWGGGGGG
jgi:hypothetical protein